MKGYFRHPKLYHFFHLTLTFTPNLMSPDTDTQIWYPILDTPLQSHTDSLIFKSTPDITPFMGPPDGDCNFLKGTRGGKSRILEVVAVILNYCGT